jgi:UDPglucose 6-dehydrogenase
LSVELCNWLINKGASIVVFDPLVKELPADWKGKIISAENALAALKSSDVLVIGTEYPEFRDQVHRIPSIYLNRQLLVLDPNHYLEKDLLANQFEGLHYVTVGSNFYGKSFNE